MNQFNKNNTTTKQKNSYLPHEYLTKGRRVEGWILWIMMFSFKRKKKIVKKEPTHLHGEFVLFSLPSIHSAFIVDERIIYSNPVDELNVPIGPETFGFERERLCGRY